MDQQQKQDGEELSIGAPRSLVLGSVGQPTAGTPRPGPLFPILLQTALALEAQRVPRPHAYLQG